MRPFFRALIVTMLVGATAMGSPMESLWGSQALAAGSALSADLVLQQGRFPLVVYLAGSYDTTALRSVEWQGGEKRDRELFPVDWATSKVRLAAQGDRVAVAWGHWSQATGYGSVLCSLRVDGVWSEPETLYEGRYPAWDFAMKPDGTLVAAAALPGRDQNTAIVRWLSRTPEGTWNSLDAVNVNRSISNLALTLDSSGKPTVAWRAYDIYTGSPPAQVEYARPIGDTWIRLHAPGASLLDALFSGPGGEPCLVSRSSEAATSFIMSLSDSGGGAAVPITEKAGGATDAATTPDGTPYVIIGESLAERHSGTWSDAPCVQSQRLETGIDGSVHLLGDKDGLLHYGTLLPGTSPVFEPLTTYSEGSAILDDVAIHPDGRARVFGWRGNSRKYSREGDSWIPTNIPTLGPGWLHAYDRSGRLHAFSGGGSYAVEEPNATMTVSSLPISVTSLSSSSLYAFILGPDDVPHVGFYTGLGTSSATVRYAVKRGAEWTVETVFPGEYSDQHCALALDPSGVPWMFTSRGLFHRTASGWVQDYETSGVKFPGLGITSDGTVHAIFRSGDLWRSLTGKDGIYLTEDFDSHQMPSTVPGFAMAGDRPLLAYAQQLNYWPTREAIVLAEKTGGTWRQRHLTERTWSGQAGEKFQLAATADGRWTLAGGFREEQNHTINNVLFVCQGQLSRFDPDTSRVAQSPAPGGGHRFQLDLETGPFLEDIQLQGSASLGSWTPLVDLGPTIRLHPGVEGLSVRGDPFRNGIAYELPAGHPSWFVRLSGVAEDEP